MENKNASAKACAIVGARGYSGLELARILLKHPQARISACFATDAAFELSDYLPERTAERVRSYAVSELEERASELHTVFLATPAEVSVELAPMLLGKNCRVIDLSGAFRLKGSTADETRALYKKWYGFDHPSPALVADAEFGLVPWAGPSKGASLIANPGCYATAALMALIPLARSGAVDLKTLVIDAKSGTSGAGRKAAENLLYNEVAGECLPYKVGAHQHLPEIRGYADQFAGKAPAAKTTATPIDPIFSTSLIPARRGIIAGVFARVTAEAAIAQAFRDAYANYPLATVTSLTAANERRALSLKRVTGSARVHLAYKVSGDKLFCFSLIDNLLKGAASQAVENFNRLNDLPVETGLGDLEGSL